MEMSSHAAGIHREAYMSQMQESTEREQRHVRIFTDNALPGIAEVIRDLCESVVADVVVATDIHHEPALQTDHTIKIFVLGSTQTEVGVRAIDTASTCPDTWIITPERQHTRPSSHILWIGDYTLQEACNTILGTSACCYSPPEPSAKDYISAALSSVLKAGGAVAYEALGDDREPSPFVWPSEDPCERPRSVAEATRRMLFHGLELADIVGGCSARRRDFVVEGFLKKTIRYADKNYRVPYLKICRQAKDLGASPMDLLRAICHCAETLHAQTKIESAKRYCEELLSDEEFVRKHEGEELWVSPNRDYEIGDMDAYLRLLKRHGQTRAKYFCSATIRFDDPSKQDVDVDTEGLAATSALMAAQCSGR